MPFKAGIRCEKRGKTIELFVLLSHLLFELKDRHCLLFSRVCHACALGLWRGLPLAPPDRYTAIYGWGDGEREEKSGGKEFPRALPAAYTHSFSFSKLSSINKMGQSWSERCLLIRENRCCQSKHRLIGTTEHGIRPPAAVAEKQDEHPPISLPKPAVPSNKEKYRCPSATTPKIVPCLDLPNNIGHTTQEDARRLVHTSMGVG